MSQIVFYLLNGTSVLSFYIDVVLTLSILYSIADHWILLAVVSQLMIICSRPIPKVHHAVIKWKHFPRYWPFVWGIHRSPVNSPRKGQWRGALMFSLIYAWMNGWVRNREAGDLIRHRALYDVTVMKGGGACVHPRASSHAICVICKRCGHGINIEIEGQGWKIAIFNRDIAIYIRPLVWYNPEYYTRKFQITDDNSSHQHNQIKVNNLSECCKISHLTTKVAWLNLYSPIALILL